MNYETEPESIDVGTQTLSAQLYQESEAGDWVLQVIIAKRQDDPPIDASAIDARLELSDGRAIEPSQWSKGTLVEAGGSLGVSANADFRFPDTGSAPRAAEVVYGGNRFRFEFQPPTTEES